jgi:hypothetical protein
VFNLLNNIRKTPFYLSKGVGWLVGLVVVILVCLLQGMNVKGLSLSKVREVRSASCDDGGEGGGGPYLLTYVTQLYTNWAESCVCVCVCRMAAEENYHVCM